MPSRPRPRDENRSRYAVLGALSIQPMSGYDLRRFFEENLAFFWSESFGQIYPILRTLDAEGCVEAEPVAGGRRRPYRITRKGRGALAEWLQQPAALEVARSEVLLKLFFAGQAPAGTAQAHLRQFRSAHAARLARYEAVAQRLNGELSGEADVAYWRATLAYGRHLSRAMLAWCDDAERILTEGQRRAGARRDPAPSRRQTKDRRR